MTGSAKQGARPEPGSGWRVRVILAVIAFVAVWPLIHRAAVAAYDLNPWKLGGWAMYSVVSPPVLVVAFEPRGDGGIPIDRRELPVYAQHSLQQFEMRRHVLGNLHRPDDFAAQVLHARPVLSEVVVMVQRMVLDTKTATMVARTMHYTYNRGGLVEERTVPAAAPGAV